MSIRSTPMWPLALALSLVFTGRANAQGTQLGFEEVFALAADRTRALEQLVPGSPEHDFYSCLLAQHEGDLPRADALLAAWRQRHGDSAELERLELRQSLLRAGQDPASTTVALVRRLGLSFDQQRRDPGAAPALPTRLDPAHLSSELLLSDVLGRHGIDLSGLEDHALPLVVARDLSDPQVTDLLTRLRRPDVPGLAGLVVRELGFEQSRGFGSLEIHQRLLLAQLEECLGARPELLVDSRFVDVYLRRLAPTADEDKTDHVVRAAHLERLERFVQRLAPAFDALKAHVGYHRLQLDVERGTLDADRLLAYLRVARQGTYAAPELLRDRPAIALGGSWSTGLADVGDDEPLVRELLTRLFMTTERGFDRFVGALRRDYVQQIFAEAMLLAGAPDPERYVALLNDPGELERLKERVELLFPRGQRCDHRRVYGPDEPVRIELDVKNVDTLLVKVFELDTLGLYEAQQRAGRLREIDASLDLDGLVAHEEQTFRYSEGPLRRVRRTFDFPRLKEAGVYVVEFIGNGTSSRAVIRKGALSASERIGAAGHVFRVLDHTGAHVTDAAIRYAGREFAADTRGEIVIPFSTDPGRRQLVLRRGDFGVLHEFTHQAERYTLEAGVHIDREALLAGEKAVVIVRPRLSLAGERVRIALLQGAALEISATDLDGVTTSTTVRDFQLSDERESTHELRVPPRTTTFSVTLRGKVQSVSTAEHVDLTASTVVLQINGIDATDAVLSPLLSRTPTGYVVEVRGKNGEAVAGHPVTFELKHKDFQRGIGAALQTDAAGQIELGALGEIERVQVTGSEFATAVWELREPLRAGAPREVHVLEGEVVRVPYDGDAAALDRSRVSLLELRAGWPAFDRSADVRLVGGYVEARGLAAGDYQLLLHETGQAFDVRVTRAARVGTHSFGVTRRLELSRPLELALVGVAVVDDELVVQLAGAGPRARVHVLAMRYVPAFDAHRQLALPRWSQLTVEPVVEPGCVYVAGRRISDEYRYVLDRRLAQRFPGNMLARAGVLLNPWAIDESTDDTLAGPGTEGGAYKSGAAEGGDWHASAFEPEPGAPGGPTQSSANLDFLAAPTALALNLVPDADRRIRVPLAVLGAHSVVRVVAVDDDVTVSRTVTRDEMPIILRDRRLAGSLDPALHVVEERRIEVVDVGASANFDEAANASVETYDSLDDVFRLFMTRTGDAQLAEFEFLLRWPSLSDDEKLERYSKFACHELHVFLRSKDPAFFERVVAPYLSNKADKTFLDHWLLGADLVRYLEPWSFAQLNTFERILLLGGAKGGAARHVRELVELLPPDQFALRTYFDAVLAGSALDTQRGGLVDSLAALKLLSDDARRDQLGVGGGGGGDFAPPAPNAPSGRPAGELWAGQALYEMDTDTAVRFVQDLEQAQVELAELDRESAEAENEDLQRRPVQRGFFRALPDTAELAERNYWRVRIADHAAELITPTPFWVDFATARQASGDAAVFLSPRFPLATRNTTEMLLALALLDLPFEAALHTTTVSGERIEFTAGSRLLMARKGLAQVRVVDGARTLLIGQDFYRLDEPFSFENGQQRDKLVSGEFLRGVPYGCRVVVTNPTSTPIDVEVLLQIPEGALPVRRGFMTKGVTTTLRGYGSASLEYAFYFPAVGTFRHFPAHVGEDGALLAFAPAVTLAVVASPTTIDTTSWEHVSQAADIEGLLRYLESANLARLDLTRVAWRMRDRATFERMIAFLRGRFTFDPTLWSFGLLHRDERATREYLEQQPELVLLCGPWFDSPWLSVRPVERRIYQHLEYDPLVNGRTHRFGPERRILNASVAQQYQSFLAVLAHKPQIDAGDRLALTYYLSLQDRIEEALATFALVDASGLESRLQYDYMRAYLAFYSPEPGAARQVAAAYVDHPVQRWRARFRAVIAQLDEAEGRGPAGVTDPESRDEQLTALAASEPSLELAVEGRRVTLTYDNVAEAEVRYRPMDIELLFSTNPFLASGGGSSFASIKPNRADRVALPAGQDTLAFDLPTELQGRNVLVEVHAGGVVRSQAYFANDLRVQGLESYGQVSVRRATDGTPLPAAYVKVYTRLANGQVRFHRDGYTDLRGRFDYASLSGMDGAAVERFAVLIMSDQHGAVVREFAPPRQ